MHARFLSCGPRKLESAVTSTASTRLGQQIICLKVCHAPCVPVPVRLIPRLLSACREVGLSSYEHPRRLLPHRVTSKVARRDFRGLGFITFASTPSDLIEVENVCRKRRQPMERANRNQLSPHPQLFLFRRDKKRVLCYRALLHVTSQKR